MNRPWFSFSNFKIVFGSVALAITLSGCQNAMDKYIDSYFERKGVEKVEQAIDKIVQKKREEARKQEEPSMEERMKHRVAVTTDGAPSRGPSDATVTIVEFSDFQCPFCKRVLPTVEEIMKEYQGKVRLAFRHNPLPFHPQALPAAKAASAANKQGKFWEMHDLLFNNQQELTDANFKKWAKQLKLNVAKFEKDEKDAATQKTIDTDSAFARANGASGTPSFFINGVLLVGAQPIERFKEVIDSLLKEKAQGGSAGAAAKEAAKPEEKKEAEKK